MQHFGQRCFNGTPLKALTLCIYSVAGRLAYKQNQMANINQCKAKTAQSSTSSNKWNLIEGAKID